MQPIDYSIQVADPLDRAFQGFATGLNMQAAQQELAANKAREARATELQPLALQGAQLGLQGQQQGLDLNASREARAAELQPLAIQGAQLGLEGQQQGIDAASAASARKQEFNATMADLAALGSDATQDDYLQAMARFPDFQKGLDDMWSSIAEGRRRGTAEVLGQAASALKSGNVELAKDLGERFKAAAELSGNETQTAAADAMLKLMEASPEDAMLSLRTLLTQVAPDVANAIFTNGREPAQFRSLRLQAEAAGLVEGTPEFAQFMRDGGGAPANFRALEMQAEAAGLQKGTPEFAQFMATRGAGAQAEARTTGTNVANIETGGQAAEAIALGRASGSASAESSREAKDMQRNMPGLRVVVDQLYDLSNTATFTRAGRLRDDARRALGLPAGEGAIDRASYIAIVDNQILPLLKQTFGAAFTAAEGDRLRETLGDPDASPEEKHAKLEAFIGQQERNMSALSGGSVEAVRSSPGVPSYLRGGDK